MADEPVPEAESEPDDHESELPVKERPLGVRMTGAAMRGLHRAIYGAQDEDIVVVADASGNPPRPDGLDLHLDPDHPEASTVVVRNRHAAQGPVHPNGGSEQDTRGETG